MLSTNITVQQAIDNCSVFVFTDRTGSYSETNLGGYGVVNPYRESLTYTITRTGADGQTLRGILTFGSDNIATLCPSDWVGGDFPCDCGCNEIVMEKNCPDDLNQDGCYTYVIEAHQTIGNALAATQTIYVLHTCNTRLRLRRASIGLGTGCDRLDEDKLRRWVRAQDFFLAVTEKQEVCCIEDSEKLEQIDLILRGIGY